MHNWRFLLLAFVAVFEPIASYSEGLVDGRQQHCDLRTTSLRDPGFSFHGTHRFTKPLDARRLSQRDVRAVRHNELKEESLRSIRTPNRRLIDTLESSGKTSRLGSSTQAQNRLAIDNIILRRETRWAQFRSEDRNQRNREIVRDRFSIVSDTRRNGLEKSQHSNKLDEDEIKINSRRTIASRTSKESRRDTGRYRDNTKLQRAHEIRVTRAVSEGARDDLTVSSRLGRERAQEMRRRAEFRVQQVRNGERQVLDRRSRNTEPRRSSISSVRVYRAYNNEDSRRNTHSLDRDERLSTRSRRSYGGNKPQLDSRIISQDRVSAEQKIIHDSPEGSEHKRVLVESGARQLGRQRFLEKRNAEWDRDARLTRFEANRVSPNLRTDALLNQRARSAESRRNVRDTRNIKLNFRSSERSVENRRDYRLTDRASLTENRRGIRNINRESRVVTQNRAIDNNRNLHKIVRESREIGDEADKENESCSSNRARLTKRRMTGQDFERFSRILAASRDTQDQKDTRNKERDTRVLGRKRAEKVDRDSRLYGRGRITDINTRMNLVDDLSARKERLLENQRVTRNAEFQRMRVERSNQRNIRNIERVTSSLERVINHQDSRENVRESRTIERASSESRGNRETRKDFRTSSLEGRQDSRNFERQSRQLGEVIIDNLRTIRFVDRDSSRRERSADSPRDIRQVQLPQAMVNRSERAAENRRVIRNIDRDSRVFRSVNDRTTSRVETETARDYQLKERENSRITERLNMRDARRSRSIRESNVEARRNSERNNFVIESRGAESRYRFNTELARKREFLNTIQNTQTESETSSINWQYLLFTLQGLYICAILSQLMNERTTGKKPRLLSWYSTPQHLIKVD